MREGSSQFKEEKEGMVGTASMNKGWLFLWKAVIFDPLPLVRIFFQTIWPENEPKGHSWGCALSNSLTLACSCLLIRDLTLYSSSEDLWMSGFLPLGNCQPRSFSCVREKGSEIEKEMVGFLFRTYFRLLILDFLLPSFRPSLLSNSLSLVHRPLKFFELCNYKGSSMRIKSKTLSCTPSNFKDKDPQILCA